MQVGTNVFFLCPTQNVYYSYIITNSISVISLVCFQPTRAVFGYEGNSNDLKVVETGGEFFIVIPSVYVESLKPCS